MKLVAAVSRSNAGRNLGNVLDIKELATPIFATAPEGLATENDYAHSEKIAVEITQILC
jgi:hypothetical protein